jgi:hypothetical protein
VARGGRGDGGAGGVGDEAPEPEVPGSGEEEGAEGAEDEEGEAAGVECGSRRRRTMVRPMAAMMSQRKSRMGMSHLSRGRGYETES